MDDHAKTVARLCAPMTAEAYEALAALVAERNEYLEMRDFYADQWEVYKSRAVAAEGERENCPICGHAWRRHDPEDGMCDAGGNCRCGRDIEFHQERIAALSRTALAGEGP